MNYKGLKAHVEIYCSFQKISEKLFTKIKITWTIDKKKDFFYDNLIT